MAKIGESESTNKINMIGVGTTIEGSINSNENIRFDGNLIGNLNTKGKVFIGQSGKVSGEIRCKNCEIEGVVDGKVIDFVALTLSRVFGQPQATDDGPVLAAFMAQDVPLRPRPRVELALHGLKTCLLYTSDAADERVRV